MLPYVGKSDGVFWCPLDEAHRTGAQPPPGDRDDVSLERWKYTSYQTWWGLGFTKYLGGDRSLRLSDVDDPSTTRYLYDTLYQKQVMKRVTEPMFFTIHGENVGNVVYLDGHAKRETIEK
jgi:prepilin-type processing-associated H-X9-DG protein